MFGTLCSTVVDFSNDTASLAQIDEFFTKFAIGSHSFVTSVMDESFVTGIVTFMVNHPD